MRAPELTYESVLDRGKKLVELIGESLDTTETVLTVLNRGKRVSEIRQIVEKDPDNFADNIKDYLSKSNEDVWIYMLLTAYSIEYSINCKVKKEVQELEKSEPSQENLDSFYGKFSQYKKSLSAPALTRHVAIGAVEEGLTKKYASLMRQAIQAEFKIND